MKTLRVLSVLVLGAIAVSGCETASPTSPDPEPALQSDEILYRTGSGNGIIHDVDFVGYGGGGFGMEGLQDRMEIVAWTRRVFDQGMDEEKATIGYLQGQEDAWGTGRVWTGKNERRGTTTAPPHPYTLCNYCFDTSAVSWLKANGYRRGLKNIYKLPYNVLVEPLSDTPHRPK